MAISSDERAELEAELVVIKNEITKCYRSKEYSDSNGDNLVRQDLPTLLKRKAKIQRRLKGSSIRELI